MLVHIEIFTVPSSKTRVSKSHVGATAPQARCIVLTAVRGANERVARRVSSIRILRGGSPRIMNLYSERRA